VVVQIAQLAYFVVFPGGDLDDIIHHVENQQLD